MKTVLVSVAVLVVAAVIYFAIRIVLIAIIVYADMQKRKGLRR